tara:strand:- start:145 stop:516 length:372 start_codon:yes stop_codon:yes gene_type:complete
MSQKKSIIRRKERRRNRSKKTSRNHSTKYRLVVYRSLKHFEAQIINDFEGKTITSASSRDNDLKTILKKVKNKTEISKAIGQALADKAKKMKIDSVVLDRNGYPYHGRLKAFAEATRENGLNL